MKLNLRFVFASIFAVVVAVGVLVFVVGYVGSVSAETNTVGLSKTLLTMPGNGVFTNNNVPLIGAKWMNDKFIISGYCSGKDNSKGLWIFSENGTQTAASDICKNAGEGASGSLDHTWGVVANIQTVGNSQFVKEMSPNNDRPPLLYSISDGSLVSRAWTAPGTGGRKGNGSDVTNNVAAISGYAVVVENGIENILYGLPNWNVLQRVPTIFTPITGVGNYFVGVQSPGNRSLVLYKVANNALQLVNKIDTSAIPVAAAVDPSSNGTRVGFLFVNDGGSGKNHVDIYTVGESGLSFSKKITLPSTATFSNTGWQGSLAISGDYTAFLDCGLSAIKAPGGTSDNASVSRCGLGVLNGSTAMEVQRLPFETTAAGTEIIPPAIRGIAMSPNGKILVVNMYGAYLYQVGISFTSPSDPNPDTDPDTFPPSGGDPGDTPQIPGQMFEVTFGATSTVPSILTRFATFGSTGTNSFTLSIFGQNYTVDISKARIVRNNWTAGALSDFTTGSYVNVFGALDLADAALIHAQTVRNPLSFGLSNLSAPRGATLPGTNSSAGTGTTGTAAVTNSALQNKLNALQESLKALQLRMNAR